MRGSSAPHSGPDSLAEPAAGRPCLLGSLTRQLLGNPGLAARHALKLAANLGRIAAGEAPMPLPADRRFSAAEWRDHPVHRRAVQAWLAGGAQISAWLADSDLDPVERQRAQYLAEQLGDALAPSNTPLHPQALRRALDSRGASIANGLRNLRQDLLHNRGLPRQVAADAFEPGRDIAATPGAVVLRSEMLELIHYQPRTARQYQRPLLIVPPQINRFYIFDLAEERSFVRYALDSGLSVFMVSWRNPRPEHRHWGLDSYVDALLEALAVCREISQGQAVNLLGACLGGLTAALLQERLASQQQGAAIASCTYLVTPLDGRSDHPALLFVDPRTREQARLRSLRQGIVPGHELARAFAWLRPRDLIWNYWTHNYLLGEQPEAFDVLHWNADNTDLPAELHGQLLALLSHPQAPAPATLAQVLDRHIDFGQVRCPRFAVAGSSDHITPWPEVYRSMQQLGGECDFVLASQGHIQAILSPPGSPRAQYVTAGLGTMPPTEWQAGAHPHAGSWWPRWRSRIQSHAGALQQSPAQPGSPAHPAITAAPGLYVRQ